MPTPETPAEEGCDRHAAVDGADDAPGTSERPVASAEGLVRVLDPGKVGCFGAGTYSFDVLSIAKPDITLTSLAEESVTLRGDIQVVPAAARSSIQGLTLNGAGGENEIGPRIYADEFLLLGNRITNEHTGICVHVDEYHDRPAPQGVRIHGNAIFGCGELPPTNHHHGIYVSEAEGTSIQDNWIYDNADRGIQLYPDAQGSIVSGNVVESNGQGLLIGGRAGACSDDNIVEGNVIANSAISWNVLSGAQGPDCAGNVVRHNCLYAKGAEEPYDSAGGVLEPARSLTARDNLTAAPEYLDRSAGDLNLAEGSRCSDFLR